MYLDLIKGYKVTICRGYNTPLKEHRENTDFIFCWFPQLVELEDRNKEVKQYKEQVEQLEDQVGLHILMKSCVTMHVVSFPDPQ